ncbi:hypothetical protein BDF21DRAFT_233868 [Thamnidium elegans]|nr:hypothetical protein BDF21DRAFT_233868 [Thamnidium elegans]
MAAYKKNLFQECLLIKKKNKRKVLVIPNVDWPPMDVDVNAQFKKGCQGSSRDRKITCNACDKVGHIMKDCWILQDHVNLL